jgi:ABC-type proline/glycine betaine transport system ATPase subunit
MIEFRHVSKTYPGSSWPVVNDLSFEVLEGEICVLVGPSGCGKTTSMRIGEPPDRTVPEARSSSTASLTPR